MRKVLVVDDHAHIRDVVVFALRREGFEPLEAGDGRAALEVFERDAPDLIILDVLMPELDGMAVCEEIRRVSNVPILLLSSKDAEPDRVAGLDAGGDDYMVKPFSPRELAARVRAMFRRVDALLEDGRPLIVGPLVIDTAARRVELGNRAVTLTRIEFGLLATLARRAGKVVAREMLMRGAYAPRRIVSDRTIDSHMRRLREKLKASGSDPVETVYGVGYRLAFD